MKVRVEDEKSHNCHGCKWLDEVKSSPLGTGDGYCCRVLRSKEQREMVRRPDMKACELYKPGAFATRYETEVEG